MHSADRCAFCQEHRRIIRLDLPAAEHMVLMEQLWDRMGRASAMRPKYRARRGMRRFR